MQDWRRPPEGRIAHGSWRLRGSDNRGRQLGEVVGSPSGLAGAGALNGRGSQSRGRSLGGRGAPGRELGRVCARGIVLVAVFAMVGGASALQAQSNCSNGTAVPNPSDNEHAVEDCEALLKIAAQWPSLGWDTDEWMGDWVGVSVNSNHRVKELSLALRGLTGTIPSSLGALTELVELVLWGNDLTREIPSGLRSLSKLETLDLGYNSLTGGVPRELGELTNLSVLWLDYNELKGELPSGLRTLDNLRSLWLRNNPNLGGDITPILRGIEGMEGLQLSGTKLTGCVPRSVTVNPRPLATSSVRLSRASYRYVSFSPFSLGDLRYCDEGPGKPSPPTVSGAGTTRLSVRWSAPVSDGGPVTGYEFQYRRSGATTYESHSYTGTGTSTAISGLSSSTTYEVRMRAENVDGWGPWSEWGSGRTYTPVYRPGQVSTPTVGGDGWESIRVSWVRPWSGNATITEYDVQYREEGSTGGFIDAGYNGTATEARISGLTTGTSYEVQVRARNRVGYGSWSASGVGTAAVRVEFGAPAYTAVEGGAGAAVTVALNEAAIRTVAVPIEITAAALTETTDYEVSGLGNGAVTFAVGESSRTVTVTALVDADSADELVELALGTLPAGVTGGATATTEVTLSDQDPLTVRLIGPAGPVEGPFKVAVAFSEEVTGFDANDVAVNDSTVTVVGSGADYVATITPSISVTVQVRARCRTMRRERAGEHGERDQRLRRVRLLFTVEHRAAPAPAPSCCPSPAAPASPSR